MASDRVGLRAATTIVAMTAVVITTGGSVPGEAASRRAEAGREWVCLPLQYRICDGVLGSTGNQRLFPREVE